MPITSFNVDIPQQTLEDLGERLARTRWTYQREDAGWKYGTSLEYLRELVQYWREQFDW